MFEEAGKVMWCLVSCYGRVDHSPASESSATFLILSVHPSSTIFRSLSCRTFVREPREHCIDARYSGCHGGKPRFFNFL